MPMLSNFWRAGAIAFLVVGFLCISGRADTRPYEYAAVGSSPFCSCASKNALDNTCGPVCQSQQCAPERLDNSCQHIIQSPKAPRPSARPDQSRPAYSRKSNRSQRA